MKFIKKKHLSQINIFLFFITFFFQNLLIVFDTQANSTTYNNEKTRYNRKSPPKITLDYSYSQEKFQTWKENFKKKALRKGISKETISLAFNKVKVVPKVIKLDRNQPTVKWNFKKYKDNILPDFFIKMAKSKLSKNKKILTQIGKEYQIQPRFIVALWGIESKFGKNTGKYKVIDALATLTFEGRRKSFFEKELINALKIINLGHITPDKMKGSWAGAMGQTQFMPSSFLSYAEDYNKDGKADIWNTKVDVFASIANYLKKSGWDYNTTWGRPVKLLNSFNKSLINLNLKKDIKNWQNLGVRKINGNDLPMPSRKIEASIIYPSNKIEDQDTAYMVYDNFKILLKWNKSLYFGTAVGIISDKIK